MGLQRLGALIFMYAVARRVDWSTIPPSATAAGSLAPQRHGRRVWSVAIMMIVDSTKRSWTRAVLRAAVWCAAVLPAAFSLAACSGAAQSGPQAAPPEAPAQAVPHIDR